MKALRQQSADIIYYLKTSYRSGYLMTPVFFFVALSLGFIWFHGVNAQDPLTLRLTGDATRELPDPNATAKYDPTVLLVKFKSTYRPKINDGNVDNPGVASVDNTFAQNDVTGFDQVAEKNSKARTNTELFGWYKVELNDGQPTQAIKEDNKTVYPELEKLQANLEKDSTVQEVTKDYLVKSADTIPNDPYYGSVGSWGQGFDDLWGLKKIKAAKAWDTTTGSSSTTVAVIDTGIDRNLSDLSGNIWSNVNDPPDGVDNDNNGYIDDTYGWNWCNNNNNSLDDHGHGTHVAGTIGALGNNANGVVGVSWHVKMMPLKFLCASGSGTMSGGAQALQYAADNGAKISSNSWSCGCYDSLTEDAIAYEIGKGTTPIVAAGNSADDALNQEPAAVDGAITVGATDSSNAIASFSNTGNRIDVVAPGVDILSLKSSQAGAVCNSVGQVVNTNYCHISGTSMATPHVSGVAALMASVNPSLNTEQIRQILRTTSQDLGTTGRDSTFGSGLIDAQAAVLASASPTVLTPKITSPATRTTITGTVNIMGTAAGSNFASYKVEVGYGRDPGSYWTTVANSNTPVTNGVLATLNTAPYFDAKCTIKITATDTNGKTYENSIYDVTIHNVDAKLEMPEIVVGKGQVKVYGKAATVGGAAFGHYTVDWGIQTVHGQAAPTMSSSGVTLINSGHTAAPNSMTELATIDTSNWQDGKSYEIRLDVYPATGQYKEHFKFISVDNTLQNGWPKRLPEADCVTWCTGNSPVFVDLNGDGNKEIVLPANSNKVYAYNKDGSSVAGWPVTLASGDFINIEGQPIASDVDGDLIPEVIIEASTSVNLTKHLYIIKGNGQIMNGWPKTLGMNGAYGDPMPSVADLNGDGTKELVVITDDATYGQKIHAFESDGSELTGFPKALGFEPWTQMPPTIFDIDNDGHPEIAVASYNQIYVFNYQGNLKPGWPITIPKSNGNDLVIKAPLSVANLRGDGNYQLIASGIVQISNINTAVYAYSSTGSLLSGWPYAAVSLAPLGSVFGTDDYAPVVADLDSDGKDEVIMPGSSTNGIDRGAAIIKDGVGPINTPYFESINNISLADIRGSGSPQITSLCYWYCPGQTYIGNFRYANSDISTYWTNVPLGDSSTGRSLTQFISADLDKNRHQEFAKTVYAKDLPETADGNYTYLWESADTSNPKDNWQMFAHDAQHTSRFISGQKGADTSAPQVVITSPAASAIVHGAVVVSANALDEEQMSRVDFYVDGSLVGTDNSWPYATTWDTTGLSAASSHSLTAKAYDTSNNNTTSAAVSVQVDDSTPPSAPANLRKVSATSTTMNVAWNASTDDIGITGYRLYKNSTLLTDQAGLSFSLSSLLPLTPYSLSVEAYDAAGNVSARTTAILTTAADTTAPSVPTNLSATNITDKSMRVNWTASTDDVGVTGYQIFRNSSLIGSTANTYFDVTGLQPLTSYSYTIKAYDADNNVSAASTPASFSTIADLIVPSAPTNLQLTNVTSQSQRLTWTAATDDIAVAGYSVYRNNQLVGTTANLYFDSGGLLASTSYTYKVVAFDAAGNRSADSSVVTGSTLAQAVTKVVGDVNGDGKVDLYDLSILLANYNKSYTAADFGSDGKVDLYDLSTLLAHYGK